jgi:short-subunit dehydrogenase
MRLAHWLAWGSVALGGYWLVRRSKSEHLPLQLRDKVILITGASSGIGRAYAQAFARCGAKIVLVARRVDMLDAVRQEIVPYAADVLVVPTDIADSEQLQALVDQTLDHFGHIDILVNNAGIDSGGPLHTIPQDLIRKTIGVNLSSAICLASLCLPSMLSRDTGWIINVSSGFGAIAGPYVAAYTASKHGLIAFSDSLRREVDGTGIRVMSVLPYWTYSEMMTADIERSLLASGIKIDTPETVAQGTIQGMLNSKQNVYFGGSIARFGFWIERHIPALMSRYWRTTVTPEYIAMTRSAKG